MRVAIPPRAHQLRHPVRLIAAGLVALCVQRGVQVPGLQQHRHQAKPAASRAAARATADRPHVRRAGTGPCILSEPGGSHQRRSRRWLLSTAAPALFTTQIAVASTPTSSPAKYVMAELRCRLGRDCDPRWTRITTEDCRLRPRASVWRIPARHAKLDCACSPCAMLQRKSTPLLLAGCCPRAISQRQPHMRNQGMLGI